MEPDEVIIEKAERAEKIVHDLKSVLNACEREPDFVGNGGSPELRTLRNNILTIRKNCDRFDGAMSKFRENVKASGGRLPQDEQDRRDVIESIEDLLSVTPTLANGALSVLNELRSRRQAPPVTFDMLRQGEMN